MKLKIMIMALLLITGIGSAAAVNRLPATEFVGDVDLGGYNITDAKMGQSMPWVVVGPHDWCDYVTDGTSDQVEINAALGAYDIVWLTPDTFYTTNTINVPQNKILTGFGSGHQTFQITSIVPSGGFDVINITGGRSIVSHLGISPTSLVSGTGIVVYGDWATVDDVNILRMANGIDLQGTVCSVSNAWIRNFNNTAIRITGNENTLDCIRADGDVGSTALYGLYVEGVGNVAVTRSEFIRSGRGFYFIDVSCAKISSTYFDQGNLSSTISTTTGGYSRHITFSNCWFAGPSSSDVFTITTGTSGTVYDIIILGSTFRDAYGSFITLLPTSGGTIKDVIISDSTYTAGGRTASGSILSVGARVSRVTLTGNRYTNSTHAGYFFPIYWNAASDRWIVTNNDFLDCTHNVSGTLPTNSIIENNLLV